MADYLNNGLLAMEKSLRDIVMPALDRSDPLAREQLNLAIDYLGFLRQRLDHVGQQLHFELEFYADMASRLLEVASDEIATDELSDVVASTSALRDDVWAAGPALREGIARLAHGIDDMIDAAARCGDDALRSTIDTVVQNSSEHWIDEELAWYAPIAVDPDAPGLRPLTSFYPFRRQVRL